MQKSERWMSQEKYEKRILEIIEREAIPYEYLGMDEYIGNKTKVNFRCKIHNNVFKTVINNFLTRHSGYCECSQNKRWNWQERIQQCEERIRKENLPYTFTIDKTKYKNQRSPINIHCNHCDKDWTTTIAQFLNKKCKCPSCTPYHRRYSIEDRKKQVLQIIDLEKLDYRLIKIDDDYNTKYSMTKLHLYCNKCECEWTTKINDFVNSGHRCPHCNKSTGETKISTFLKEHNVNFEREYRFNDCKYKYRLPFDFYLQEYNLCIEYDGIQHFKPVTFAGKNDLFCTERFRQTVEKDNIKNQFCLDRGIKLLRFNYLHSDSYIQNTLLNELKLEDVKCEEILKA